ncbi:acyltransferase family protein [Peribacillus kribbensis]|uniref:acyltransferase family protein n=1 Tax=Peribacillus kribbensis TaxID=356658 RepID=UPI0004218682|nr:acyltransferase [Peribacillus kribbensis]
MINSLTSFRFFAALMVFLFHMGIFTQFQLGAAGVSFFFILSGFILAYNYKMKLTVINKEVLISFYKARFAKIYPVHILTFLISVPLVILTFKPDNLYLVKFAFMSAINLLLIQSFFPNPGTYFNFNGVSWTLSVEAFFYFTFPFILRVLLKLNVAKNWLATIIGTTVIWCLLLYANISLGETYSFFIWFLHIFPAARLYEFGIGVFMGIVFWGINRNWFSKSKYLYSLLEFLAVAILLVMMLCSSNLSSTVVRGVYYIPVCSLIIFVFAFQKGILSEFLANKIFIYLGEISFSFYMIHQLVIRYFGNFALDSSVKLLMCFTISLVLSIVIYQTYEEPMRKRIRYGAKKKTNHALIDKHFSQFQSD